MSIKNFVKNAVLFYVEGKNKGIKERTGDVYSFAQIKSGLSQELNNFKFLLKDDPCYCNSFFITESNIPDVRKEELINCYKNLSEEELSDILGEVYREYDSNQQQSAASAFNKCNMI